jgi:predicted RNA-binding Zn ribbon-like protein
MTKILADTADTVVFDPENWVDVIDDPRAIARGLENCQQAYLTLRGLYEELSPEEQKTLFPDGLPQP